MFADTYIVSRHGHDMKCFCDDFPNVLGPCAGFAAVAEQVLEDGFIIPAQAERGNPLCYYACIRSTEPLLLPEGITVCAQAEGREVLGVWA